jgi:hypothetical protein
MTVGLSVSFWYIADWELQCGQAQACAYIYICICVYICMAYSGQSMCCCSHGKDIEMQFDSGVGLIGISALRQTMAFSFMALKQSLNCASQTISTSQRFTLPLMPSALALWRVHMWNLENLHSAYGGIFFLCSSMIKLLTQPRHSSYGVVFHATHCNRHELNTVPQYLLAQ